MQEKAASEEDKIKIDQVKWDYLDDHLPYEMKMVRFTYQQMLQRQFYLSWNAHFESFAVNARRLKLFLTNTDDGNLKAHQFVDGYKAMIGDHSGRMQQLDAQVFHNSPRKRPTDVIGKFDTDDARLILEWIEKNFSEFLEGLKKRGWRNHYNDQKADPKSDQVVTLSIDKSGSVVQTACTASSSTMSVAGGGPSTAGLTFSG